ncbi:MAG: ribosome recycling factor [Clostridia bacterium]|nr:ribosome recycling factor [Clostridia bacterium]
MKDIIVDAERRMNGAIDHLESDYKGIRAGRANPAVLDKITVDYWGSPTPINQMASIAVAEARVLAISPYDASQLRNIEKAIQKSDLGVNPQNDGKIIRLVFPPLTEDRRKELVKDVSKMAEEAKVHIRNVRRDAMDDLKKKKKANELTEDDLKTAEKKIQDITDKKVKEVEAVASAKEKELMSV